MLFTILKKHLQITPPLPKLLFQQCQLEYVTVHKNLSLTFSNDFSWSLYINNIVNNAYTKKTWPWLAKKIKIYCRKKCVSLGVRSSGGCTGSHQSEKVQILAAGIVTGHPVLASYNSLYFEIGCGLVSNRRQTAKLTNIIKFHNNLIL